MELRCSLGTEASPVYEISTAPPFSRIFFARSRSLLSSVWMDNRMLPSLTLPSYRFASYSGMPIPISAPVRPPAAAPPAAPAKAAMIGPAAMKTPSPGIAKAPIPTIQPSAPPRTAPLAPPVAAPSGALVCCSCAKSLLPCLSGKRTEMSFSVKPAALRLSAMSIAWDSLFAMPNTAFFAMLYLLLTFDFDLVVDLVGTGYLLRLARDRGLFFFGLDRATQRDAAIVGDDLHVMRQHRKRAILDHRPANLASEFDIAFGVRLRGGGHRARIAISNIHRRVVGCDRRRILRHRDSAQPQQGRGQYQGQCYSFQS